MDGEKKDNSVSEAEMNHSSSSLSSDIRDWELVDADLENGKSDKSNENTNENELENIPSPSGLFVHSTIPRHSGVEELRIDQDHFGHTESNSSSDIDVIDECPEENNSNSMSIQSMDISFCHSEISSTMSVSEKESADQSDPLPDSSGNQDSVDSQPPPAPENNRRSLFHYFQIVMDTLRLMLDAVNTFRGDRGSPREFFIIFLMTSVFVVYPFSQLASNKEALQDTKLKQMEDYIHKLVSENEHLKNKVIGKIEGGKIFGELDEEMKNLRYENFKLQEAMQTVMYQLEKQTHTIRKGLEAKENINKEQYKKEIEKLKEQINSLRTDNEDLQKQLVMLRYGKHASQGASIDGQSHDEDASFDDTGEKLTDTQKKLQQLMDVYEKYKAEHGSFFPDDVENEAEDNIINEEKENYKNKKSEDDKSKHKRQKNRKFYNWSWKDIKKNVKGTLGNIPDVISNYVLIDKKTVGSVFDTVSHYYKKAQDKAKKILESYSVDKKTETVTADIWTLMREMKNKWIDMKNKFMETHFQESEEEFSSSKSSKYPPHSRDHENDELSKLRDKVENFDKKYDDLVRSHKKQKDDTEFSGDKKIKNSGDKWKGSRKFKEWQEKMKNLGMRETDELLREVENKFSKEISDMNSWLFERAQHRAELRDNQEKEPDLNWYLRRSELLKESEATDSNAEE